MAKIYQIDNASIRHAIRAASLRKAVPPKHKFQCWNFLDVTLSRAVQYLTEGVTAVRPTTIIITALAIVALAYALQ